jgi:hypothetical protein
MVNRLQPELTNGLPTQDGQTQADRGEPEFSAAIARARAQVKAAQVVDGQTIAAWLAPWGT